MIVLAICINLPLFLFQAIALGASGISPVAYLPDLLWRQLFSSVFLLLPAAALAAVTRTQGQFALAVLLVAAHLPVGPGWPGTGNICWRQAPSQDGGGSAGTGNISSVARNGSMPVPSR